MRKKIEELRNKEEGFTLVELLAVIVILGIIIAIAIPAVGSVIDNAQTDANVAEEQLVEDAARLYFSNSENSEAPEVDLNTLIKDGYVEDRDEDLTKRIPATTTYTNPYLNSTDNDDSTGD